MGQVYKNAGIEAARVAGRDPAMDILAAKVKAAVLLEAAKHNKTGDYTSRIHSKDVPGRSGVRDRAVYSTDPNVLSIEYGHWWVTPAGIRIKWVAGIRIFNRAFNKLKKG